MDDPGGMMTGPGSERGNIFPYMNLALWVLCNVSTFCVHRNPDSRGTSRFASIYMIMCNPRESSCSSESFFSVVPGPGLTDCRRISSSILLLSRSKWGILRNSGIGGATISGNCHLRLAIATGGTGYHRIGGEGCSQHFLALRFYPH